MFISTFLHVSCNYVLSGLQTWSADQTATIQSEKYQCCTDTVSSPDDGHMVARNM